MNDLRNWFGDLTKQHIAELRSNPGLAQELDSASDEQLMAQAILECCQDKVGEA